MTTGRISSSMTVAVMIPERFGRMNVPPNSLSRRNMTGVSGKFSPKMMLCDGEELDIAPGIVSGGFQFITGRWDHFQGLIRTLRWS